MRNPMFALALVCCGPAFAGERDADVRAVLEVERALTDAFQAEDGDALEALLHPQFTLIDSRGALTTRAQEADELRSGRVRYDVFRNHGSRVRFHGGAAIVTGFTTAKGMFDGEAFEAEFAFTDVYARGADGRWQLVAGHASRVPTAQP